MFNNTFDEEYDNLIRYMKLLLLGYTIALGTVVWVMKTIISVYPNYLGDSLMIPLMVCVFMSCLYLSYKFILNIVTSIIAIYVMTKDKDRW